MYFRKKISGGRVYLQIAESRRVGGQVRQRVVATLGRLDALQASGHLERLVCSGALRSMVSTRCKSRRTGCAACNAVFDPDLEQDGNTNIVGRHALPHQNRAIHRHAGGLLPGNGRRSSARPELLLQGLQA
jgi:hypothetical protein